MLGSCPLGDEAICAAPNDGWATIPALSTTWADPSAGVNPWTILD